MTSNYISRGAECCLQVWQLVEAHPLLVLCFAILVVVLGRQLCGAVGWQNQTAARRLSPDAEKSSQHGLRSMARQSGEWKPVDFKRPIAPPYPGWSVHDTKPLPYRPFRHGPYYITMGLRSMHWDEWIELDNQFPKFHADKMRRIKARGPRLSKTAPEAFDGAIELLEEFCDYLPQRYPSLFQKTEVGMDNLFTGESFNIVERPLNEDPMQMAGRMIQDDLAIMFEKPDGQYYFSAGSIILPGFWRLEDKFGMPLSEIHDSGNVPGFKTKLEKGMVNFFRRVQPNAPVLRFNYFLQVDDNLGWSDSIGLEDEAGHGNGGGSHTAKTGWSTAERNKAIEHHWFRSERQSLRRLPRTGGVVFTIRTYFHPITEIAEEPGVPGRLASAVRSWGDDVARYKGREVYQDALFRSLTDCIRTGLTYLYVNNTYLHKKNHNKFKGSFPTHFIVLTDIHRLPPDIHRLPGQEDMVDIVYWDYGGRTLRQVSLRFLKKITFGVSVCTKESPRQTTVQSPAQLSAQAPTQSPAQSPTQ